MKWHCETPQARHYKYSQDPFTTYRRTLDRCWQNIQGLFAPEWFIRQDPSALFDALHIFPRHDAWKIYTDRDYWEELCDAIADEIYRVGQTLRTKEQS
jgi:hypothetical protein